MTVHNAQDQFVIVLVEVVKRMYSHVTDLAALENLDS